MNCIMFCVVRLAPMIFFYLFIFFFGVNVLRVHHDDISMFDIYVYCGRLTHHLSSLDNGLLPVQLALI